MYQDALLTFADSQAVTAAAISNNGIDLSAVRDAGVGEPLYVVCVCEVAMTDASSDSTLAVALEGDSVSPDSGTMTPDYTRTLFTFSAVSAAGTVKYSRLGPDDLNLRYAQLKFTPANGNLTTGTFTAFITHDIQKYTSYADSITIS